MLAQPACVCPQAVGSHPSSFLSASLLSALMLGCLLLLWLLARCVQILSRLLTAVEKLETSTCIGSDRETCPSKSSSMASQVQPRSPTPRMRRSSSASAFTEIPDPMPVRRKPSTSNGFLDLPRRLQRSSSASALTEIPDDDDDDDVPMPVRRTTST